MRSERVDFVGDIDALNLVAMSLALDLAILTMIEMIWMGIMNKLRVKCLV